MSDVQCGRHNLKLEEVRPGKFLCPEPECTHIVTADQMVKMRDLMWAQANGMVHPDAIEIPSTATGTNRKDADA